MLNRDLTKTIKDLMKRFPIVALIGARQVGKSTLIKNLFPKIKYYDLESESDFNYINSDPELFLDKQKELLVLDEAQLCTKLFPALRVHIDKNRSKKGQVLISGSSSPELQKNISESLAGRIAILEVPTLTWSEALKTKSSSFYDNLDDSSKFEKLKANFSPEQITELCFYGSYPEPFLNRKDKIFYQQWQENYFKTYIERDIRSLFPQLQLESYRRLIRMLAISSGEILKASNFANSLDLSEPTVKRYLDIAEGTFIWSRLKPYSKNLNKRLVKMPKGYLRDNVLTNYLLNINDIDTLVSHPNYGQIWETFIIEQIRKNLNSRLIRHQLYFYRTHSGAEIDLLIETGSSLIPIEIKSGKSVKVEKLKALTNFIEENNCPYGLVINHSNEVRQISKTIYQIPATHI